MGDKFKNISNSTIINRSVAEHVVNRYGSNDPELASAIKEVATYIHESDNTSAGLLFDQFAKAADTEKPDKSKLRKFWDDLVAVMPGVESVAGAATVAARLIA